MRSLAHILPRHDGATIAYHRVAGISPGIVFLGGFRSEMTGSKALFLEDYCRRRGHGFVRFDYFGHDASSGVFAQGTIGRFAEDAIAVVDSLSEGKQILVGSSMGGWIMLLAARARLERIHALVGVAAAPDFTEELFWARLDAAQEREFRERGVISLPSEYDPAGYTYCISFFEEAKRHLVMRRPIGILCPVRLLHGMRDQSVPWRTSLDLAERLESRDVTLTLVKEGDHRLSSTADRARLGATLDALLGR
jgi:pimeloyl-ACP methyl ester carboxylesterase